MIDDATVADPDSSSDITATQLAQDLAELLARLQDSSRDDWSPAPAASAWEHLRALHCELSHGRTK